MPLDYQKFNDAVEQWAANGTKQLMQSGRGFGIEHVPRSPSPSESLKRLKERFGFDKGGVINRVSFGNINRSLIYTMYGAGKGRGGTKGSRWIDKHGNRKQTKSTSLGKMGGGDRKAKPFIDNVLDGAEGVEKLADIVAEHQADAIIGEILVK